MCVLLPVAFKLFNSPAVNKLQDRYKQYNSIKHREMHIVRWFIVNAMTTLLTPTNRFQYRPAISSARNEFYEAKLGTGHGSLSSNSTDTTNFLSRPAIVKLHLLEWLYSPCGPSPLVQFPDLFYSTIGRTPWMSDQLIARPLPKLGTGNGR
jgi:hypothetical protein